MKQREDISKIIKNMNDKAGIQLRIRENGVLTTLRRIIPGEYRAVREISHPTLSEFGFDFENARVVTDKLKQPFLAYFLEDTLSERTDVVAGMIRAKGDWTLVYEVGESTAAASLWVASVMDFPDRFLKGLLSIGISTGVFMRPMKSGWLVAVQASFLKHIIKNANRRDY